MYLRHRSWVSGASARWSCGRRRTWTRWDRPLSGSTETGRVKWPSSASRLGWTAHPHNVMEDRLWSFRGRVVTTGIIAAGAVGSASGTRTTRSAVGSFFTGATALALRPNESQPTRLGGGDDGRVAGSDGRRRPTSG